MSAESRRELLARLVHDAGRVAAPHLERRLGSARELLGETEPDTAVRAGTVRAPASRQAVLDLARELGIALPEQALRDAIRVSVVLTIAGRGRDLDATSRGSDGTALSLRMDDRALEGSGFPPGPGRLNLVRGGDGRWAVSCDPTPTDTPHHGRSVFTGASTRMLSSRELVLPREWSDEVQELCLDETGIAAWRRLRERLAASQGRDLYGESDGVISHRWLGIPDERSGSMPLECELRARGVFRDGVVPFAHEQASAASSHCRDWRLLLQLSPDARIGWHWGDAGERLYVWLRDSDLSRSQFERAQVLQR